MISLTLIFNNHVPGNHRLIKSRCFNDPCFSRYVLILDKHCIYAACLSLKRCIKRSYQSKVPSIQFKHCFFPLSFFSTAVLYLLMFESSIVIVNPVKELGPFYNLWVYEFSWQGHNHGWLSLALIIDWRVVMCSIRISHN